MTVLMLELPEPPSANRYYRRAGTHLHRSAEANAYRERVLAEYIRTAKRMDATFPKPLEVAVTYRWFRSAKRGDLDNRLKIIGDSLNGLAWDDDSQVVRITAERYDDKQRPRLEVVVEAA
jgi:crossover junction endodeoxyribonuclease RusA